MTHELVAMLVDDARIGVDELACSCAVERTWIVEFVQAGVLLENPERDPARWAFTSHDLLRARRLRDVAQQFDANPELAGLVVDLLEELERLRVRSRREGVPLD
jgi:chaperone modulatory protein CbpM